MRKHSILIYLVVLNCLYGLKRAEATAPPSGMTFNWSSSYCLGGGNALTGTGVWINYTTTFSSRAAVFQSSSHVQVDFNSSSLNFDYNFENFGPLNVTAVQYDMVQLEHGGGECHCVQLGILHSTDSLCGGVAYEPRRIVFEWNATYPLVINIVQGPAKNFLPPFTLQCTDYSTRMYISFTIHDSSFFCNTTGLKPVDDIEFSIQLLSYPTQWIPIAVLSFNTSHTHTSVRRRGYNTPIISPGHHDDTMHRHQYRFQLCNISQVNSFQLRWIVTNMHFDRSRDKWGLDDVEVVYGYRNKVNYTIFSDSFSTPSLNNTNWTPSNIRNGYIKEDCNETDHNFALSFGTNVSEEYEANLITNAALTNKICISNYVGIYTLVEDVLQPLDTTALDKILNEAAYCELDEDLSDINSSDLLYQLQLNNYYNNILLEIYIFAYFLDSSSSEDYLSSYFERTCDIGNSIIQQSGFQEVVAEEYLYYAVGGVTLLQSLDQLLFLLNQPISYSTNESLAIAIEEYTNSVFASFSTANFYGWSPPYISATLPIEDLQKQFGFYGSSIQAMISVYRNVSQILPRGQNNLVGVQLISDVVGININCFGSVCPTPNISLSNPVRISFDHGSSLTESLQQNSTLTTVCAFLEIFPSSSLLYYGQWSTYGCSKNNQLSSISRTVCECSHLTHFGILLSARPIQISQRHRLALSLIGYVGVSISIIAMAVTVAIFIAFKSLRSLRNYIHGNLCINLAISQIIFVAGVDRTTDDTVPIHCQVIAVLLHYFFLVSFMWMLMEGIYLYIVLFKVFEKRSTPYLISFTVISYGLPLIYMGVLTLPMGFLYFNMPQYGYHSACFLAVDYHFIWAFIAPVIAIFLANIAFFIMAAIVTYRHMKKKSKLNRIQEVLSWLKGILSLTVIMGLTWIIGLAAVEEVNLTFLVYLYTILTAFQGTFIFIIFVVFAKSVQDSFRACWMRKIKHSNAVSRFHSMKMRHVQMKATDNQNLNTPDKSTEL